MGALLLVGGFCLALLAYVHRKWRWSSCSKWRGTSLALAPPVAPHLPAPFDATFGLQYFFRGGGHLKGALELRTDSVLLLDMNGPPPFISS
jgi:hypothetical protein